VRSFNYIADPDKTRMDGFLAQQLQPILPYAVTVPKEDKDQTGKMIPWQVDYSKVVPLIAASIQELYHKWMDDSQSLHREIASVKAQNEELKQENLRKEKELSELRARVERIEKALVK
jgi:hypothetical protein